uniref:Uncharacterized protein n=1 Tax=Zea mays TaxID=4577 RepID=A0A804PLK8_MAIZE
MGQERLAREAHRGRAGSGQHAHAGAAPVPNAGRRSRAGPNWGRHAARGGEGRACRAGRRAWGKGRGRLGQRGAEPGGERVGPPCHNRTTRRPGPGKKRGRRGRGGRERGASWGRGR